MYDSHVHFWYLSHVAFCHFVSYLKNVFDQSKKRIQWFGIHSKCIGFRWINKQIIIQPLQNRVKIRITSIQNVHFLSCFMYILLNRCEHLPVYLLIIPMTRGGRGIFRGDFTNFILLSVCWISHALLASSIDILTSNNRISQRGTQSVTT